MFSPPAAISTVSFARAARTLIGEVACLGGRPMRAARLLARVVTVALGSLVACATAPRPLYHWDGYQRVMETGHTDYGGRLIEVPAVHRDGHTLSVAFTVTLLTRPGERRPEAIAAVLRDDTARRTELLSLRARVAALEADRESSSGID